MTKKLSSTALCLSLGGVLFCAAPAYAKDTLKVQPSLSSPVHAASENIRRAVLPNGLKVVVIQNTLAPVVTTQLSYLTGSNEAPEGFPGTAHALEHMMFRGSQGLDKDQLAAVGARLGGSYNADTTETVTRYYYTAPVEDLDVLLKVEALRMQGLTLAAQDWEKERGAIEQEVARDLSSPIYKYVSKLQQIMFAGTPYEHDALGTRPSFDKTDISLLRKFYHDWYAPNNAILVIAGNVDPHATIQKVYEAFQDIPSRPVPRKKSFSLTPIKAQTLNFPTNYPVGLVTVAYRMPGMTAKDFATATILSDVMASQRGKLYQLVVDGKALDAGFEYLPKADVGFGIAMAAFKKGDDPKPTLKYIRDILEDIRKNGVPEDLVKAAKNKELARLGFAANSVSGLASSWTEALAFQKANSPDDMLAAFSAVTPEDVNSMARKILDARHAVTAILTPEDSSKPITGKGFGGAESFASTPDKPVQLPEWAQKALNKLNLPAPMPAPSVFTLKNGMTLIVLPSNVSHTVSVYGSIRQNSALQEPAGKEGIASLTDELFGYGTKSYNRVEFQKALDDIAADADAGSSFSLQVLTPHFEEGMRLLAENELRPAFPQKAFDIVRQQHMQSLSGLLKSPDYLFGRAIQKAVSPAGDPALREATPKTVGSITLADVQHYYQQTYRPDLTTMVVIGDISVEHAREVVEKYFNPWKAEGPTPVVDLPPRPDSKKTSAFVPDRSSVQSKVILAQSIGLTATSPERFALFLGNSILGDGFSSRLYRDMRVKTGYVYNVSSDITLSRTRGGYTIDFGTDPDKVKLAHDAALRNLKDMQHAPVSEEELNLAKASMLRSIPLRYASVDSIAENYISLHETGLPLNMPEIAARRYMAITPQDVQQAFKKWIRPQDLADITKGPQPSRP